MSVLPPFSIHLITSRTRLAPEAPTLAREIAALERQIDEAIDAGIDVVQIRERDLEGGVLAALVSRIVARGASTPTVVLVNERADVACGAGAGGLHLPSSGMPAGRVRQLAPTWVVGRSIHAGDDPSDKADCDYLLFGTVFPSESKVGGAVAGCEGLARAARQFSQPVVALGGVTPARLASCLDAGARGVAAIGAFLPPGRGRDGCGAREAVLQFRAAAGARQTC